MTGLNCRNPYTRMLCVTLALFAAGLLLSGCTSLSDVQQFGAGTADTSLETGRVLTCEAATLGALARKYGPDQQSLIKHLAFCGWTIPRGAE